MKQPANPPAPGGRESGPNSACESVGERLKRIEVPAGLRAFHARLIEVLSVGETTADWTEGEGVPHPAEELGGRLAGLVVQSFPYEDNLTQSLQEFVIETPPSARAFAAAKRVGLFLKGWGKAPVVEALVTEVGDRRYGRGADGGSGEVSVLLAALAGMRATFPDARRAIEGVAFSCSWPDPGAYRFLARYRASGRPCAESIDDVVFALTLVAEHAGETRVADELTALAFDRRKDIRERLAAARALTRVPAHVFASCFYQALGAEDSRSQGVAAATLFLPRPEVDRRIREDPPSDQDEHWEAIQGRAREMEGRLLEFARALVPHFITAGVPSSVAEGRALRRVLDLVRWAAVRSDQDPRVRRLAQTYLRVEALTHPGGGGKERV